MVPLLKMKFYNFNLDKFNEMKDQDRDEVSSAIPYLVDAY